jgi:hypothetical protein
MNPKPKPPTPAIPSDDCARIGLPQHVVERVYPVPPGGRPAPIVPANAKVRR